MAKIIAKTERTFLVEMTQGEIAQILGPGYAHLVLKENRHVFETGAEIPVSESWQRLQGIATLQRTLDGVAHELRKTADWLDTIPAITAPVEKKTGKDKGVAK